MHARAGRLAADHAKGRRGPSSAGADQACRRGPAGRHGADAACILPCMHARCLAESREHGADAACMHGKIPTSGCCMHAPLLLYGPARFNLGHCLDRRPAQYHCWNCLWGSLRVMDCLWGSLRVMDCLWGSLRVMDCLWGSLRVILPSMTGHDSWRAENLTHGSKSD